MLNQPSEQVKNALHHLARSEPAFDIVVEWLASSKEKLVEDSEKIQEVPLYRNQGARQALSDFSAALKAATTPQTHS